MTSADGDRDPTAEPPDVEEAPVEALWQLVYSSAASPAFDVADLRDILRLARERNTPNGVTGMLLFEGGSFLQVIEGPGETVDSLYDRIREDPRHTRVVMLLREPIEKRSFGDWTMGYSRVELGELENAAGVHDFHRNASSFTGYSDAKARKVLALFRTGSFRQRLT